MVICFDLDGVLLKETTYWPQTEALYAAIEFAHGLQRNEVRKIEIDRHGKTDMQVARELCGKLEIEFKRDYTADIYRRIFPDYCPGDLRGQVSYGANFALWALREHSLRLVTGNLYDIAAEKVERAGLLYHLEMLNGGYGDESEYRVEILEATAPKGSWYVCDTRQDVEAGTAAGMKCLGIPSTETTIGELELAGCVAVFNNLPLMAHYIGQL